MLALSRPRGSRVDGGDAWRSASALASLEFKRQLVQLQLEEASSERRRRILSALRRMEATDAKDESEYEPSEESEGESDEQSEESESGEEEEDDDSRWWDSMEDKRTWEKNYRQADAAFRKKFGCAIDTPTHPETRRKIRKEKKRHQAYTFVLAALVMAFVAQLVVVYSTSSWAFSMVTWQVPTIENGDGNTADKVSETHIDAVSKSIVPASRHVPEHVRTGLYLCSTLSRRVVKSEHDVTATQHALRACDIAVKFAPPNSREATEAQVLRGDLRSLLSNFDGADEDYKAAMLSIEFDRRSTDPTLASGLSEDLELKRIANRWTKLYKTKQFKELRRDAKAKAVQVMDDESELESPVNAVGELAADWLRAFKRKKPVLDVLTMQRGWTMRRLQYEALDDGDDTNPNEVRTS